MNGRTDKADKETEGPTGRRADGLTGRLADGQTGRQADWQTDRQDDGLTGGQGMGKALYPSYIAYRAASFPASLPILLPAFQSFCLPVGPPAQKLILNMPSCLKCHLISHVMLPRSFHALFSFILFALAPFLGCIICLCSLDVLLLH